MESRLDRPKRPVHALGDALKRQVGPEAEHDDCSLVGRELAEAAEDRIAVDQCLERIATDRFGGSLDRDEADRFAGVASGPCSC